MAIETTPMLETMNPSMVNGCSPSGKKKRGRRKGAKSLGLGEKKKKRKEGVGHYQRLNERMDGEGSWSASTQEPRFEYGNSPTGLFE